MNTTTETLQLLAVDLANEMGNEALDWMDSPEEAQAWAQEFMPADLTQLSEYRFVLRGAFKTFDGEAWSGEILRDGQVVVRVENDGRGGPNFYQGCNNEELRRYTDSCRVAFPGIKWEVEDHATNLLDIISR